MKDLQVNKDDIINALKNSTELELNRDSDSVRRKDNKALPELSLLKKKRRADNDLEGKKKNVKEEDKLYDT